MAARSPSPSIASPRSSSPADHSPSRRPQHHPMADARPPSPQAAGIHCRPHLPVPTIPGAALSSEHHRLLLLLPSLFARGPDQQPPWPPSPAILCFLQSPLHHRPLHPSPTISSPHLQLPITQLQSHPPPPADHHLCRHTAEHHLPTLAISNTNSTPPTPASSPLQTSAAAPEPDPTSTQARPLHSTSSRLLLLLPNLRPPMSTPVDPLQRSPCGALLIQSRDLDICLMKIGCRIGFSLEAWNLSNLHGILRRIMVLESVDFKIFRGAGIEVKT